MQSWTALGLAVPGDVFLALSGLIQAIVAQGFIKRASSSLTKLLEQATNLVVALHRPKTIPRFRVLVY